MVGLVFHPDWLICRDYTVMLDIDKANEVGWVLTIPQVRAGTFLTLMSKLLDLLFAVSLRVSSFYFFPFSILIGSLSIPVVG